MIDPRFAGVALFKQASGTRMQEEQQEMQCRA